MEVLDDDCRVNLRHTLALACISQNLGRISEKKVSTKYAEFGTFWAELIPF
jgi:hypothetical protein